MYHVATDWKTYSGNWGQAFNITNGDVYVWRNLWPAIARSLGMEEGAPRPMELSVEMPKTYVTRDVYRSDLKEIRDLLKTEM